MLVQFGVPSRFWHFAYNTAVYLINRMPSRTLSNISPLDHTFSHKQDYSFLRVFGCFCYPHLRPYNNHKMDFHSIPCVFLGYSTSHHGYQCLDPTTDRIYISRHVRFNEYTFPFLQTSTTPTTPSSSNPYVSSYLHPTLSTNSKSIPNPTHHTVSEQLPNSPL